MLAAHRCIECPAKAFPESEAAGACDPFTCTKRGAKVFTYDSTPHGYTLTCPGCAAKLSTVNCVGDFPVSCPLCRTQFVKRGTLEPDTGSAVAREPRSPHLVGSTSEKPPA